MFKAFLLLLAFTFSLTTLTSQTMKVKPGANVTVQQGTTLKCAGGSLLLEDDYTTSPSFLERGNLTFNSPYKAYLQQYLEKDEWHLVSQPTATAQIGVYLWIFLYQWLEPTGTYQYLNLPVTIPMNPGEGYWAQPYTSDPPWPASPDSVMFRGTLNKADLYYPLSYTPSSPNAGWNVVGNPFPCAVNYDGSAAWNLVNINNTIYFYDGNSGSYATWNWFTGIGTNGKHNGYIPSTQGFAVIANAANASLTFPESKRLHSDTTEFFKSSFTGSLLRLKGSGGGYAHETVIAFTPQATEEFDNDLDGYFMKGFSPKISLYSVYGDVDYTVNMLPSTEDHKSVPLSFEFFQPWDCTFSASGIESFDAAVPVILEDKLLSVFHDLKANPDYHFYSEPGDDPARFVVHFANPLGENEFNDTNSIQVYSAEQTIRVVMPWGISGSAEVFDISGRKVHSAPVHPGMNILPVDQINNLYMVMVYNGSDYSVFKTFVK